jgi:hypothetical protein
MVEKFADPSSLLVSPKRPFFIFYGGSYYGTGYDWISELPEVT